jgi:hypothetical protein
MKPLFTRKHYIAVAKLLRCEKPEYKDWRDYWQEICLYFADMFQEDNSSFNRDKFLTACEATE